MHMETKWVELTRNQTLDNTDKDQEDFRCDLNSRIRHLLFRFTIQSRRTGTGNTYRRTTARKTNGSYDFCKSKRSRGINSWGADVESPYRISSEEDHEIGFIIR